MTAALLFLGTLAIGLVTCRWALWLVRRLDLVDVPNERSSHQRPTPRGGGLGILPAIFSGAAAGAILLGTGSHDPFVVSALGIAVITLAVLGLCDDRKEVRPAVKALFQLLAALLVVLAAGTVGEVALPVIGAIPLGILGAPLSIFWLVGFSNAFNFMDGIDGIAGLHAGIAAMFFGTAAAISGGGGLLWMAIPLSGACLAFLSVNWPPARVFMGDVGSLPVGFLLAALGVIGARAGVPFMTSFLILGPFLYDTVFTIGRRLYHRENLTKAHRSHLYQRLVILGLSQRRVTLLYGAWTLLTGLLGLMYLSGGTAIRGAVLFAALLSGLGITVLTGCLEQRMSGDGRHA